MFKNLIRFSCLLAVALAYDNHKVVKTDKLTLPQATFLRGLENAGKYDFWRTARTAGQAQIIVAPEKLEELLASLHEHDIGSEIIIENVQKVLDENKPRKSKSPAKGPSERITFTEYHTHDEINAYIDSLSGSQPWINTVSIGRTYENNDMRSIEFTKAGNGKPNVFVEAGIHAREWIAPAVATYLIAQLAENSAENMNYLDNLNIYVLPVANPDGYEYTWSDDRLWRKNRDPNPGSICAGVDLNRNWDYHWHESGVSDNECADTFPGEVAFSELESQNMRDYVLGMSPVPSLSVALHSAAELFLYPYGYAYDSFPDNVDEIMDLGQRGVDALNAKNGESFQLSNAADLYPAAGASDDWYKGVMDVRYVYTPELREGPVSVFVLPEEEILPSGEEMWEAFKVFFQQVIDDNAGK